LATVRLLNLDATPFERILKLHAKKDSALTDAEANDVFGSYMAEIGKVIEAVDRHQGDRLKLKAMCCRR